VLDKLKPWDMDVDISGKPALKPFNSGAELVENLFSALATLTVIWASV
jgi:oligoendopeptidase F